MKPPSHRRLNRAATLLEMTIVIMILLALTGGSLYLGGRIGDWRSGRNAAETLRTVYAAQRMFLSENPTVKVADLTPEQLIPYLPRGTTAMPTVTSLEDEELQIKITVSPPVVDAGGGEVYDPSPSPKDGLWDIGR